MLEEWLVNLLYPCQDRDGSARVFPSDCDSFQERKESLESKNLSDLLAVERIIFCLFQEAFEKKES